MTQQSPYVRARVSLAVAARDVAEQGRVIVGDISTPMPPGERIRAARRVRLLTWSLIDRAVLAELSDGATWDQIAEALGTSRFEAQRRYASMWVQWQGGLAENEIDGDEHSLGLRGDLDLAGTAQSLDQWWLRHSEPWETTQGGGDAGGAGASPGARRLGRSPGLRAQRTAAGR